jgi:hypothetical protein
MIGEVLVQVVGEFVGYGTGCVIVSLFTPHIRIARGETPPWPDPLRNRGFFSLTFVRDGHRYYLSETITAIGVVFWVVVIGIVAILATRGSAN